MLIHSSLDLVVDSDVEDLVLKEVDSEEVEGVVLSDLEEDYGVEGPNRQPFGISFMESTQHFGF